MGYKSFGLPNFVPLNTMSFLFQVKSNAITASESCVSRTRITHYKYSNYSVASKIMILYDDCDILIKNTNLD